MCVCFDGRGFGCLAMGCGSTADYTWKQLSNPFSASLVLHSLLTPSCCSATWDRRSLPHLGTPFGGRSAACPCPKRNALAVPVVWGLHSHQKLPLGRVFRHQGRWDRPPQEVWLCHILRRVWNSEWKFIFVDRLSPKCLLAEYSISAKEVNMIFLYQALDFISCTQYLTTSQLNWFSAEDKIQNLKNPKIFPKQLGPWTLEVTEFGFLLTQKFTETFQGIFGKLAIFENFMSNKHSGSWLTRSLTVAAGVMLFWFFFFLLCILYTLCILTRLFGAL